MSMDIRDLGRAVAAHGRVARVVVASVEGSAPREPGAAMLVWPGGQSGTIGGGALEFEAAAHARNALDDGSDSLVSRSLGPALGQCCGGAVVLATEIYDETRLAGVPANTYLRRVTGQSDPPLALQRAAARNRSSGEIAQTLCQSGWLIEPIAPHLRPLWIYGAGHVGRAIVDVMAPLPGIAITWVDTGADRFPDELPVSVTRLLAANPAGAVRHAPSDAEHLVLTYSHALDLEICHQLLGHGFRATGLIGSATKWARFRSRLRSLGHSDAQISRIRCPIGDPELGKHPQAVAVGIAAEWLSESSPAVAEVEAST
ncbi:MAG: xanthine dehydrogenase accessory protein XdhC [Boseongicola sp. SB0664_bin_43]|uniref:Xanthine dehydrogenase accessory protein XdhC n=1 Tax=Boseongicola sp. SB0664_bin_43 TaxID=2604844 RepID=A0A6B0XX52_9RHOB|nr:xanthine dehydrogenase accessory protein XdhC [Boseongicola sp. SB0664_bin_43]